MGAKGYEYIKGTDKHIIWGYMQIGEIEPIDGKALYDSWKLSHPHYLYRGREQNTAYIAAKSLSFNNDFQGCGVFNYSDSLVLTQRGQRKRSVWKLPRYFHSNKGTKFSYHKKLVSDTGKKIWDLKDDHCILNSAGRGQEFVIEGISYIPHVPYSNSTPTTERHAPLRFE